VTRMLWATWPHHPAMQTAGHLLMTSSFGMSWLHTLQASGTFTFVNTLRLQNMLLCCSVLEIKVQSILNDYEIYRNICFLLAIKLFADRASEYDRSFWNMNCAIFSSLCTINVWQARCFK
jgi:hypothetical protein